MSKPTTSASVVNHEHHAHTAPSHQARHHTHTASETNPNKIIVNPVKKKKREARNRFGYAPHNAWQRATLPQATPAVPSPLGLFTSVFGMGTGVTSSLWPPGKSVLLIKELISI